MPGADFIVVGTGIAGISAGQALESKGASVLYINDPNLPPATASAPALINPVTGRQFVKSWKIDELIPFSLSWYGQFEKRFNRPFTQSVDIFRALSSPDSKKRWEERSLDESYKKYVDGAIHLSDFQGLEEIEYGIVSGGIQVNLTALVDVWNEEKMADGMLILEPFQHAGLACEDNGINYGEISARGIIFAEGFNIVHNPLFKGDFFHPNKGEYLICRIPGLALPTDIALKHGIFIAPLNNDHFWVGATYDRDDFSNKPTAGAFFNLSSSLDKILNVPWELVAHRAAVRPTVKDRRPIIGAHPELQGVYFFNGMGTKGASLAPFLGAHFVNWLLDGKELIPEINIGRFWPPIA